MQELTRIRSEQGWSQQRLAEESGVNKATINQIERGRRSPNVETLEKLAAALSVEVGDFFPKAQAPLPDFDRQRRESRLPDVADNLLVLAKHLLETWTAELPERAQADDDEWLGNIAAAWQVFGEIFYDVAKELGPDGVHDLEAWFAMYMDVNTAAQNLNAAIFEHSIVAGASSEEKAAVTLRPLVRA